MLPSSDSTTKWPPPHMAEIFTRMNQWSALFTGDLGTIQAAFAAGSTEQPNSERTGMRAAIGRSVQRFFLGEATQGGEKNTKVPVPIAAEICQASADLLFADPITVTAGDDEATEERLKVLLDDRFHAALAQSAEVGAALGGSYLRAMWDVATYADRPFTTVVDADNALPEFTFGKLRAVTFWWVVKRSDEQVWRHLERHELDPQGHGVIRHGLFHGNEDVLGIRVPLADVESTAGLAIHTDLNDEGTLSTRGPGLAVQYLPNQTPNRSWRSHAVGRYLGRSDLDGIEHLIDQLAEVMSAWLRAIRLAKARLFISKSLLADAGPGKGQVANLEAEAYTQVTKLGETPLSDLIHLEQAKVEYEQYRATAEALIEQILQMAGYSAQTFGQGSIAAAATATEIESRERRSLMTRDRKIREQKPGIGEHIAKLLQLDNQFFGGANDLDDIDVVFADGVQQSQLALAQTVQALYVAESASIGTRVAILHPDWDDQAVKDEVGKIRDEFASASFPSFGGTFTDTTGDVAPTA